MKQIICLLAAGLSSGFLVAQPSENWTEVNLAVTDNHVIPRYREFADTASALDASSVAFCGDPNEQSLADFRNAFHASMDDWQQIQHVQFGPITYFNWNYRLQYWPDENGTGARQLDALIARQNTQALASDSFARESVGVQGFPALERLLFDEDSLAELQSDPFRCQVALTIARNISEIATGVHARWVEEFRTTVANADERGFFENAQDATIDFLKSQIDPVRRVQQQKLEAVIGETAGRERVRRSESWRSARSLRNIRLNVLALDNLFNGEETQTAKLRNVLLQEDDEGINTIFSELEDSLAALPDSLEPVLAEEDGRERLTNVISQLDALFEALEAALKNTDLYLGFNSLDGD